MIRATIYEFKIIEINTIFSLQISGGRMQGLPNTFNMGAMLQEIRQSGTIYSIFMANIFF